jgi:hypothetical protein
MSTEFQSPTVQNPSQNVATRKKGGQVDRILVTTGLKP